MILDTGGGFSLVINDSIVFSSNQIHFYDFSSHLIYLKDDYFFSFMEVAGVAVTTLRAILFASISRAEAWLP